MKHGEEVKISKRAGSYVTVRDLVNEVGRDAVRYFFLMRKSDSQLIFNVDLAASQSRKTRSITSRCARTHVWNLPRRRNRSTTVSARSDYEVLSEPEEQQLIKALLDFPALVESPRDARAAPRRHLSHETARLAHLWYHKHHVLEQLKT